MIPLFSNDSLIVLESLSFTKTLYAFDFDGTLAKIVRNPDDAQMNRSTVQLMHQLSQLVPVAIISGRSFNDIKSRIPFQSRFLIGNHGLEGSNNQTVSLANAQEMCDLWMQTLNKNTFESGVQIENKTYSIALHYRRARNKTRAKAQLNEVVKNLFPTPYVILGKCVINIIPANAPHKGAALLKLIHLSGMNHAFYIGDDDTDEDIFSLSYGPGQIMTVRVGKNKKSHASYYIDRQTEINQVLKLLIRFHQNVSAPKFMEAPL